MVTRRQLRRGVAHPTLPEVPDLPEASGRGVGAVLKRSRATCLVRATVRQGWLAAHGDRRDLVIGVTAPAAGFKAHAWLDGDSESEDGSYTEILRRPALSLDSRS